MGIVLGSNFTMNAALPLDDRATFADITARDLLNSGKRYEGLIVYVEADEKSYQLQGGITNGDWVEFGASATPFDGTVTDTLNFVEAYTSDTGSVPALAIANKSFCILTGTISEIHGIATPSAGKNAILIVRNQQGTDIVIKNSSASATLPANRILTGVGSDIDLLDDACLILIYDYNAEFWQVVGGAGGGGGGGVGPINRTTNLTLTMDGYIAIDTSLTEQTVYVSGNTAATDLDQYQPFGTQQPAIDASIVHVIGADDTKTIRLQNGDIGQWAAVGPFSDLTFAKYYSATFKFDVLNEKWVLIGKNF